MLILNMLLLVLFCYLFFFNFYFLVFSVAGRIRKRDLGSKVVDIESGKFLVLIPTYMEDSVILSSAKQASIHNYQKTSLMFL